MEQEKTIQEKRKDYNPFKKAICDYLRNRAEKEPDFKAKLKNPEKNIDECLNYIIGEVQKTGRNGFADEEIYSLAVHYYDEPNDKLKKYGKNNCKVIVNQKIELSEEEKEKAKKEAYERYVTDQKRELEEKERKEKERQKEAAKKKAEQSAAGMQSLF